MYGISRVTVNIFDMECSGFECKLSDIDLLNIVNAFDVFYFQLMNWSLNQLSNFKHFCIDIPFQSSGYFFVLNLLKLIQKTI